MLDLREILFARKKRETNNEIAEQAYKVARNRAGKKNQKQKQKYHDAYFSEHQNDIKKTWEGLRKLVKVKKLFICQLKVNEKIVDDLAMSAEKL